jgi:hypothetical protein
MEKQGFTVFPTEWWHFDYRAWKGYAIQNVPFEQIGVSATKTLSGGPDTHP